MGYAYGCQDHALRSVRVEVGEAAKLDVRGKENVLPPNAKMWAVEQQVGRL